MTDTGSTRPIYLVGSVPLSDAAEVIETVASRLGDGIARIPDGETGERTNWIAFQRQILRDHPDLEEMEPDPAHPQRPPKFRLKAGASGSVRFGAFGYAKAAKESWPVFERLQAAGKVPAGTRFLVALPTHYAAVAQYIDTDSQDAIEPGYAAALYAEVDEILCAIPHDRLAIQWDTAVEFAVLEGLVRVPFAPAFDGLVARALADCARVPEPVELGIHLCYGDYGHKHFKEPEDAGHLAAFANALAAQAPRPIQWLHLPVPIQRDDAAYFAPLKALKLRPETELVLGLLHEQDGVEGAKRRIAAASSAVTDFGVATECGFGRRPAEAVRPLLDLHLEASAI